MIWQPECSKLASLLPSWTRAFASTGVILSTWGVPGNPWKSIKFQACSQYPQISLKVSPRSPKVTKMTPKTLPGDTKFVNKWKTWNITKTIVFIVFIAHTATGFQQHFYLWIIKTMDLETVSHFGTQIIDKSQKGLQNVSQEPPQLDPKIYKNGLLDPNVSIGRPSGSLDHQSCPQGTQTEASSSPKWQFWVQKVT